MEGDMEKERMKLSVVILNWNTKKLLEQCLNSVTSDQWLAVSERNKKTPNHQSPITEIVVVDNGSTDGSLEVIKSLKSKVESKEIVFNLIENKENLGYAKGNNLGIRAAKGEYVMVLNTDTLIREGAIETLINFLDKNGQIDVVGPRILNPDGSSQASCGYFPSLAVSFVMLFKEHFGGSDLVRWSPKSSQYVDWLVGAAFIARKKVYEKIGGFDERIFMYMEEVEWFYRSNLAGFKTYFLSGPEVVHLERGSSKTGKKDPILNIYKGLLYFYKKHKSLPEQIILTLMLKTKALLALIIGHIKGDNYLKETYGEAFKIS